MGIRLIPRSLHSCLDSLMVSVVGRHTIFRLQDCAVSPRYLPVQKFIDRERELCDVITSSTSPRKEDTKELEILWEMQV